MKALLLIIIFTISGSLLAASATTTTAPTKKSGVYGDVVVSNTLQKMLEVNGVKPIYDDCVKSYETDKQEIPNCIWLKVKDKPDLKKAVLAVYSDELKAKPIDPSNNSRAPASKTPTPSNSNLTLRKEAVTFDYESDPTVKALSDFYQTKLDAILNPEKALSKADLASGKILVVDHKQFIELYKTELGKTIISAFTSYCLDTKPGSCCTDTHDSAACKTQRCQVEKPNTQDLKDARVANLKEIKDGSINLQSGTTTANKWTNCILDVTDVCTIGEGKKDGSVVDPAVGENDPESVTRACLIVDYVKAARKNIIVADQQKEFYDKEIASNFKGIGDNFVDVTTDKKIASVLDITSKDVTDSLKNPTDKVSKEIAECTDAKTILNADKCKQFLNTNKDANTAAIAEFGLRQIAQENQLDEELKSPDKVKAYLKEEGFKESEINTMTSKENIDEVTKQIKERFAAQKEAIIKDMASKVEAKTSSTDGKIDAKSTTDLDKLKTIKDELSTRASDLGNLVQFNNVISSYLTVENGSTKKVERNTASLLAEVKSIDKADSNNAKDALQKQVELAKLKDQDSSANLNVDTINQSFLNYDKIKP